MEDSTRNYSVNSEQLLANKIKHYGMSVEPFDPSVMNLEFVAFYYDAEVNRFFNEDGAYEPNILDHITPTDLLLFKQYKGYMIFDHRFDRTKMCELHYPDQDDLPFIIYNL